MTQPPYPGSQPDTPVPPPPQYYPTAGQPQPYGQPGVPQAPPQPYSAPASASNPFAVAGLIAAIVGLLLFGIILGPLGIILGPLGVVFGALGMNKAKSLPSRKGNTMSIWAIVLGIITTLFSVVAIGAFL